MIANVQYCLSKNGVGISNEMKMDVRQYKVKIPNLAFEMEYVRGVDKSWKKI